MVQCVIKMQKTWDPIMAQLLAEGRASYIICRTRCKREAQSPLFKRKGKVPLKALKFKAFFPLAVSLSICYAAFICYLLLF